MTSGSRFLSPGVPDVPDVPVVPALNYVTLARRAAAYEAVWSERRQIEAGIATCDEVREDPARRRGVLKSVTAESGDEEESVSGVRRAD